MKGVRRGCEGVKRGWFKPGCVCIRKCFSIGSTSSIGSSSKNEMIENPKFNRGSLKSSSPGLFRTYKLLTGPFILPVRLNLLLFREQRFFVSKFLLVPSKRGPRIGHLYYQNSLRS